MRHRGFNPVRRFCYITIVGRTGRTSFARIGLEVPAWIGEDHPISLIRESKLSGAEFGLLFYTTPLLLKAERAGHDPPLSVAGHAAGFSGRRWLALLRQDPSSYCINAIHRRFADHRRRWASATLPPTLKRGGMTVKLPRQF
jgi:hypothetical protein